MSLQEGAYTPSCCACTMRAYHHAEAPQAQVILPKLHHHAEELLPHRRSKSRRRVSAHRCLLVTPITNHIFVCTKITFSHGFAFVLGFARNVKEEALERCEGQVGNT